MNVAENVAEIEAAGATFRLDGEKVRVCYPDEERRAELADLDEWLSAQRVVKGGVN